MSVLPVVPQPDYPPIPVTTANMPSILDLSEELIGMVLSELDDQYLPNVRQTCKHLCRSAHKKFIERHIVERNHVVSPNSIATLTKITAHPVFGPWVKSIILNGADDFGLTGEPEESLHFNHFHESDQMETIFTNLMRFGNNGITIGVTDNYPQYEQSSCISDEFWQKSEKPSFGWSDLMLKVQPFDLGNVDLTISPSLLLEHMADRAKRVGLRVKCVEIRMVGFELNEHVWEEFPFQMQHYCKLFQCNVQLTLGASALKQTQQPFSTISYNQLTKIWKFGNLSNAYSSDNFCFCELVLQIIGDEARMNLGPFSSASKIIDDRLRELLSTEASGNTVNSFSTQELTQYLKLKMGHQAVNWAESSYLAVSECYHH